MTNDVAQMLDWILANTRYKSESMIARLLGVARSTVMRWHKGVTAARSRHLRSIIDKFPGMPDAIRSKVR